MKKMAYAPGCALLCYKPHLAEKLGKVIAELYGDVDLQQICCFDRPPLDEGTPISSRLAVPASGSMNRTIPSAPRNSF